MSRSRSYSESDKMKTNNVLNININSCELCGKYYCKQYIYSLYCNKCYSNLNNENEKCIFNTKLFIFFITCLSIMYVLFGPETGNHEDYKYLVKSGMFTFYVMTIIIKLDL